LPEVVSETFIWTGAMFCYWHWQMECCSPLKLGMEFANAISVNSWLLNLVFCVTF